MLVFYDEKDKIGKGILQSSRVDVPVTNINPSYDLFSEVYPEDYDNFLQFVCLKLGKGQSGMFQGINTPMKPGNVIRSNDGQVKYICGRCGGTFLKAPRCPGCGQLVKA